MNKWQKLHEQYAQDAFLGNGHAYTQEAKIAELERLIWFGWMPCCAAI